MDEGVIYREEVVTIMGVIGDIRFELQQIRGALTDEDDETEAEENG